MYCNIFTQLVIPETLFIGDCLSVLPLSFCLFLHLSNVYVRWMFFFPVADVHLSPGCDRRVSAVDMPRLDGATPLLLAVACSQEALPTIPRQLNGNTVPIFFPKHPKEDMLTTLVLF